MHNNGTKTNNAASPVSVLEKITLTPVSRRNLFGMAGQGILGMGLLTLLGGGSVANAAGRTPLEGMLPGAKEIRPAGAPELRGSGSLKSLLADSMSDYLPSLPMWGDGQNFDQPQYYETLCVGDVDGDGQDELIIRGPAGILVEQFNPRIGQWVTLTTAGPLLSDENGWDQPQYYQTIQCVDVDGDGKAEIVARGKNGIIAYQYVETVKNGIITREFNPLPTGPFFGDTNDNGIWTKEVHYATIKWGDAKGIGLNFVVGRHTNGIVTWYYAAETQTWYVPYFNYGPWPDKDSSNNTNWTLPQYYETIQMADIDGDGQVELLGRSATGLEVWKFVKSDSKWEMMYGNGGILGDAGGWNLPLYYQTIQCADIDGDGTKEIIARGSGGIVAYRYNSSTGEFDQLANGPSWVDNSIWAQQQYYSSIRFGDVDGDGLEEMIGRDQNGIQTWKYWNFGGANTWIQLDGNNPSPQPAWNDSGTGADANGTQWDEVQYYSTFRFARTFPDNSGQRFPNLNCGPTHDGSGGPRVGPYATLIGRDKYGIQTWRYQQKNNNREDGGYYVRSSAPLPDFTSDNADANLAAAYNALDIAIRGSGASGNIRDTYNDTSADFTTWMGQMYDMPLGTTYYGPYIAPKAATPSGIDATAWQKVTWQIYWEMAYVVKVNDWFQNKVHGLITDMTIGKDLTVQTIGSIMSIPQTDKTTVAMDVGALLFNCAWAVLGFPGLADADGAFAALPGQLSAISGVLSTGFSAAATFLGDGGGWQGAYAQLEEELVDAFGESLTTNNAVNLAITGGANLLPTYQPGDFGTLAAIGQQILAAATNSPWTWPTSTTDVVKNVERTYALQVWKTAIVASNWFIGYDSTYGPDGQIYVYQPPSHKPDYDVWLANGGIKTKQPSQSAQDALFKTPTNDTDLTPMGVPMADVFEGQNGWPKLSTQDFGGYIPGIGKPTLPRKGADLQCQLIFLERDTANGHILATISVPNKGLLSATNVEIVSGTLGSRPAIEPLPQRRTRVAGGKMWNTTVRFPANVGASGQTVVLRLTGKYKGGTFGGSFRVKLP